MIGGDNISIITVNFNNKEGLDRTLKSINFSNNFLYEVIVVDGGSNDGSHSIIKKHQKYHKDYNFFFGRDNGIFDAMNKGILASKYKWIIFMNSGDCFYDCKIIESIIKINKTNDVIYGNHKMRNKIYKAQKLEILKSGIINACHQSMLFNHERLKTNLIYGNYKLYGDYELVNRLYLNGFKFKYIDKCFSEIEPNGISQKITKTKRIEKFKIILASYGIKGLFNAYLK